MKRTEVHKFGGTSVGGAERIAAVTALLVEAARDRSVVAVCSAMSGVTDALVTLAADAAGGRRERCLRAVDELLSRHVEKLALLGVEDEGRTRLELESICRELRDLVRSAALLGELTPRSRDRLLACGEKLSVRLVAASLRRSGVDAVALDCDTFLETDAEFGSANPLLGVADRAIRSTVRPVLESGAVAVITGFAGRAPDGATTTLGRGGSDLSATFVAAALEADEVVIWTDVDGVYSADPRIVPGARPIPHLNYREAAELSFYGAKVLHQRSMIPVVARGLPVRIKSSFDPGLAGSLVDGRHSPGSHPVKAISAIRGQSLVSIEGKGMAGVPGVAARVFRALAGRAISVTMISQSSSESSICLAVPDESSLAAESVLKREFRAELSRGEVEDIEVRSDIGLVAAVGLGMAHAPGIAARVFGALARHRINVAAIAQGSSELNISFAVEGPFVDAAVRAVHDEFGLHRLDTGEDAEGRFDLLFLGLGSIGRELARLVLQRDRHVFERFGLHPRIVAVADRSGFLLRPTGIPRAELEALLESKASGKHIADHEGGVASDDPEEMVLRATEYRLSQPVLVDVSDSDASHRAFRTALQRGCDVVTANKKPLAGALERWRELMQLATPSGRVLKAEATVGAGLPVIDTVEMLLATGDRIRRAEGCLSGTLAFLMGRLEAGQPFSSSVAEAVSLGYTEPDPVADLSGADVGRKAVILGRLSGLVLSNEPIALEGLVDARLSGLGLDDLIARLAAEYDGPLAERMREARGRGNTLRYVARIVPGAIEVGPVEVANDSPLGQLRGTDNMILFETERYDATPLVVSGPGAGVEVTAMGVLADILRVAAERRGIA